MWHRRTKIKQLEAAATKPRMQLGASPPTKRKAGVGLLLGKFESDHHHSDKIFILQIVPGGAAETSSDIEVRERHPRGCVLGCGGVVGVLRADRSVLCTAVVALLSLLPSLLVLVLVWFWFDVVDVVVGRCGREA